MAESISGPSGYVSKNCNLFEEYLQLLGSGIEPTDPQEIGPDDVLIVIDMQADFFPRHPVTNPLGGRFGVAEAETIVDPIVLMMEHFGARGATVVTCRDYHPVDHISFNTDGGNLPAHCVESTPGSFIIPPIASTMGRLIAVNGPEKAIVVFKGFHEDIDSYGGFSYSTEYAKPRLAIRDGFDMDSCQPCAPCGCSLTPWTGCLALKQSAVLHAYRTKEDIDINTAPDVLACVEDGRSRNLRLEMRNNRRNNHTLGTCSTPGTCSTTLTHRAPSLLAPAAFGASSSPAPSPHMTRSPSLIIVSSPLPPSLLAVPSPPPPSILLCRHPNCSPSLAGPSLLLSRARSVFSSVVSLSTSAC